MKLEKVAELREKPAKAATAHEHSCADPIAETQAACSMRSDFVDAMVTELDIETDARNWKIGRKWSTWGLIKASSKRFCSSRTGMM